MRKVLSALLVLAVACLVAVNSASAQDKKKDRPNPEKRFDDMEKAVNHDPLKGELTKEEFVKAMKATSPRGGDRAEAFFDRIKKVDEKKITKDEFVKAMKEMRSNRGGKRGGDKKPPEKKD